MKKQFLDAFKRVTYSYHSWQVWSDFIDMSACAISNTVDASRYQVREKQYMNTLNRYSEKEQAVFPELLGITISALDLNPEQDFLGQLFMELELGSHWKGQFFTPYSVCSLMAGLNADITEIVRDKGYASVNDCACGAGALLIAFANETQKRGINYQNHIEFVAQDIDYTAAQMCYIQLSFLGCAGYIVVGDTLRDPVITSESNVWYTPMYFSQVWRWRRLFQTLDRSVKNNELRIM